jgi:hypothetical protein
MGIFTRIWDGITSVLGLILPFFAKAKGVRKFGRQLRMVLGFLLLLAILVFLGFLNSFTGFKIYVVSVFEPLREYIFLPLVFLLFYLCVWLGYLAWKLWGSEDEDSIFPDIDEAWEEGLRALGQAGIELTEVPLFMVLGRTGLTEEAAFQASQVQFMVKQVPSRGTAPVRVWGNRDAVYVTAPGASLLGRQAAILLGEVGGGSEGEGGEVVDDDPNKTLQPKGRLLDVQAVLARAREQGRDPQQLTEDEKAEIRELLAAEEAEQGQRAGKARTALLKNQQEVERLTARFRHLCRLIVRDRRPYCPLNGILLLFPLAATDSDDDATQTGDLCARDLRAAREVLQVHCPLLAMVCDLQNVPGFRDFIERFPEKERGRRVGQRFPLVPDVEPAKIEAKIDEAVRWVCNMLVPSWVYKLFRVETTKDAMSEMVRGNVRLYKFMDLIRGRQKRLSKILNRGVLTDDNGPLLFGGCYVGGTGRDGREQGFVAGVFQRLTLEQNYVSWTEKGLAEESRYRQLTNMGYMAIGILLLVIVGLGYVIWGQIKSGA